MSTALELVPVDNLERVVKETVRMEAYRVGGRFQASEELLRDAHVSLHLQHATGRLVGEIYTHVYGQRGTGVWTYESWWDHLKHEIRQHPRCPAWLRSRLSVNRISHSPYRYLPDLPYRHGLGQEVVFWKSEE